MELFATEGKESFGFVASHKTLASNGSLTRGDQGDALLVLMKLVALVLHVKDGPMSSFRERSLIRQPNLPILRRNLVRARSVPHADMISLLRMTDKEGECCGVKLLVRFCN